MRILEMIESGKISAEEGLRLLQALSGPTDESPSEDELVQLARQDLQPPLKRPRHTRF